MESVGGGAASHPTPPPTHHLLVWGVIKLTNSDVPFTSSSHHHNTITLGRQCEATPSIWKVTLFLATWDSWSLNLIMTVTMAPETTSLTALPQLANPETYRASTLEYIPRAQLAAR